MTRLILLASVASGLLSAPIAAQTAAAAPPAAAPGSAISRLDKNADGAISRDEATPALLRAFPRFDKNKDDRLDAGEIAELRSFLEQRRAQNETGDAPSSEKAPAPQPGARPGAQIATMNDEQRARIRERIQARRGQSATPPASVNDDGDGVAGVTLVEKTGTTPTSADIVAHLQRMTKELGLKGAAVIIARGDGKGGWTDVVRSYTGDMTPDSQEAVASATKWYTAVTVGTVVEQGKLTWDAPITQCFPKLKGDAAAITLRQTLSHVSGIPALSPMVEARFPDLEASAQNALAQPPVGKPGTTMVYSGTAFQVAARCAEVGSGKDFRTLFAERIATPLALKQTVYGGVGHAPTTGGGLGTTPAELETFTRMIANRGQLNGKRVIQEATLRDMTRLVTKNAQVSRIPGAAKPFAGMGTGIWCERSDADDICTSVSSVGAFGAYAWVDYARNEYGVFFVRNSLPRVMPWWRGIRAALNQISN